jgi:hypothetical protein
MIFYDGISCSARGDIHFARSFFPVGTEKSLGDLRDCLVSLRPRSCRGENGIIHKKKDN